MCRKPPNAIEAPSCQTSIVSPVIQAAWRRSYGGPPAGPAGCTVQAAMCTTTQTPMISSKMVTTRTTRPSVRNWPIMPMPDHSSSMPRLFMTNCISALCRKAVPAATASV
ncbi:hypothetical protein D3C72_1834750 [compost metagenome]